MYTDHQIEKLVSIWIDAFYSSLYDKPNQTKPNQSKSNQTYRIHICYVSGIYENSKAHYNLSLPLKLILK